MSEKYAAILKILTAPSLCLLFGFYCLLLILCVCVYVCVRPMLSFYCFCECESAFVYVCVCVYFKDQTYSSVLSIFHKILQSPPYLPQFHRIVLLNLTHSTTNMRPVEILEPLGENTGSRQCLAKHEPIKYHNLEYTRIIKIFFVWELLLIVHTLNSSPLQSNLLQPQCTCCTVPTIFWKPHGSPLVWVCQWPSSQPLSSPQLSHNDSLWA